MYANGVGIGMKVNIIIKNKRLIHVVLQEGYTECFAVAPGASTGSIVVLLLVAMGRPRTVTPMLVFDWFDPLIINRQPSSQ